MLSGKPYAYGTFYLPHDAQNKSFQTGKSVREQLIAAGCDTRMVPSLSVQDGIQAVRKTLPNVYFNTASKEVRDGLNALKSYQRVWDPKKMIFSPQPLHNWASDPADAFRYLCLAMNPFAAKKGGALIHTRKETPANNVMNLQNLFADRESKRAGNPRI